MLLFKAIHKAAWPRKNKQNPPKLSFAKRMKIGRGPFGLTGYIYLYKNSWVSLCWVRKTLTTTSQWKLTELYSKSLSWAWSQSVTLWYRLWPPGEPTSTHQSRKIFVLSSSIFLSWQILLSLLLLHFFQHHKLHQDFAVLAFQTHKLITTVKFVLLCSKGAVTLRFTFLNRFGC